MAIKKWVLLVAGGTILLWNAIAFLAGEQMSTPSVAADSKPLVLLNQAAWSDEQRQDWYHTSAGTQLLPFDWFMALNDEALKTSLHRTGVLLDPANKDGLAVGFAETKGNGVPSSQLGLTCAFCHTTEFKYQGTTFRIDGGPSLQFNAKFVQGLIQRVGELKKDPEKRDAFVAAVLQRKKQAATPEAQQALMQQVATFMQAFRDRAGRDPSPLFWGPGRFDALGRGGNLVFSQLNPDNLRPANAPVSIPALWGAWEYDRVQWGGSIQHPLARNIAQVIGVNANMFSSPAPPFGPQVDHNDPFRSSVDVAKLKILEGLAEKLHPPRWPKEFPAIDPAKAGRGKELYGGIDGKKGLCAHCHVAEALAARNGQGARLKVTMIPQQEMGTDPLYLTNFSARRVDTGALGMGRLTAKDATKLLTDEIMKRAGVADDPRYRGIANEWSDSRQFIARPHVAVWATAPYLHNGSVPTLYELLSPAEERRDCFAMSPLMEFDPVKVGFVVGGCEQDAVGADGFKFDTSLPGNSNRGHEFRNTPHCAEAEKEDGILGCEIAADDRSAIIEYLKTCDLDQAVFNQSSCPDLGEPKTKPRPS